MCNHLRLCLFNFVYMCPSVNVYMSVYLCMYKGVCLYVCVLVCVYVWACEVFQFKNLWTESKIFRNNMLSSLHFRFNWEQLTKSVFLKYLIILYQIYQNLEYIWDSPILVNTLTLQDVSWEYFVSLYLTINISLDTPVWLSTHSPVSCPITLASECRISVCPDHVGSGARAFCVFWACYLSQLLWEPQMSQMSENHSLYTEERGQLHTKLSWYPCLLHVFLKPVPVQLMFIHSFLDS